MVHCMKRHLLLSLLLLTACFKEPPSKPKQYIPPLTDFYTGSWFVTDTVTDNVSGGAEIYDTAASIVRATDTTVIFQDFFRDICPQLHARVMLDTIVPISDSMCNKADFPFDFIGTRKDAVITFSYKKTTSDSASGLIYSYRGRAVKRW